MSVSSSDNGSRPTSVGRGHTRGFTIEDGREMRRLYEEEQLTPREIAQRYDCTKGTIHHWLTKVGYEPRRTWLSRREREQVILLLNRGLTIAAVSEQTGRSGPTVRLIAHDEGIKPGGAKRLLKPNAIDIGLKPEVVVSAARRHGNMAGVQRELGMSAAMVERVLEEHAPEVLRYHIRGGAGLRPNAELIEHNMQHYRSLEQMYRDRLVNWDEVIEDYGLEAVKRWVAELRADRTALSQLISAMSKAAESR